MPGRLKTIVAMLTFRVFLWLRPSRRDLETSDTDAARFIADTYG
jgi:hypothetical protein